MKTNRNWQKNLLLILASCLIEIALTHAASKEAVNKVAAAKSFAAAKSAGISASGALDTGTVRRLYLDGDFDEAIKLLETALKEKRAFNHDDSVLIFKHLGVMYAANYETREKGKYYMHQLLMVEPTARILDMYASDMIYMIFKNIQDEFESSRTKYERAQSHLAGNRMTEEEPQSMPKSLPKEFAEPKRSHAFAYWIGATGTVIAVGVTAYLVVVNQSGGTLTVNHPVSK